MTTHERDDSVPELFMRHVGNVLRCTCGAAYVAGYRCPIQEHDAATQT